MADSAEFPCRHRDTGADTPSSRPRVVFNPTPTYIRDSLLAAKRQPVSCPSAKTADISQWSTAVSTSFDCGGASTLYARRFESLGPPPNAVTPPNSENAAAKASWDCGHCHVLREAQEIAREYTDFVCRRPFHANTLQANVGCSEFSCSAKLSANMDTCARQNAQQLDSSGHFSFRDEATKAAKEYAEHLTHHRPNPRFPSPSNIPPGTAGNFCAERFLARQRSSVFNAQRAAADYTSTLYQTASSIVSSPLTRLPQTASPDDAVESIHAPMAEPSRETVYEGEESFTARSKGGSKAGIASESDPLPPHKRAEQEGTEMQTAQQGHAHLSVGKQGGGLTAEKKLRTEKYLEGSETMNKEGLAALRACREWMHERNRLHAEYGSLHGFRPLLDMTGVLTRFFTMINKLFCSRLSLQDE
ncbi:conserved hypothetical protein [Neospora caninum Liverpool]|uniref:Uncharacterized protein n=1 Tax=Neospora caninum (strain Liverpool) TaxID=572307 RepID=F0VJB8_NEOCL|nr:conserved hypothetical protein [Neospora caninum Liverpool]CBZ53829.1 conserved hypothetical protein [Neospora caninum Liverpool]CEL67823.1 TPA: hypothetical protein BN1204_036100 [Neospora caninum Liverpool]|eukprot:XP_003883861.1 conserved hypothetical protein [Neospora caninum Liverpool]